MGDFVAELSRLNHPPSRIEKDCLTSLIIEQEADIVRLDVRINDADAALAALRLQREQRVERVRQFKHFLSPIRRLPYEMLGEIFRWCHAIIPSPKTHALHDRDKARNTSPLLMCQVCASWRQVAISTPELWSSLKISFPQNSSVSHLIAGAITRVQRATRGVAVKIELPIASWTKVYRPVSTIFHAHSHLLTSISCAFFTWDDLQKAFPSSPSHKDATMLRNVRLGDALDGSIDLRDLAFPWSQLTSLEIGSHLPLMATSEVLSMCTNLMECQLKVITDATVPASRLAIGVLPSLRVLRLRFTEHIAAPHRHRFTHFFDALTMPALCELELHMIETREDLDLRMVAFKKRSSLNLHRLEMTWGSVSSNQLIAFLKDMPALTTLTLEYTGAILTQQFMQALTFRHPAQELHLAPNLDVLTMSSEDRQQAAYLESVLDMIESRCPPGGQPPDPSITYLKTIDIDPGSLVSSPDTIWYDSPGLGIKERVDACVARGLEVFGWD